MANLEKVAELAHISPDCGYVRLPVCRVLRLAGEGLSVVRPGGAEAEGGHGGETLAVRKELPHGGDPFPHHRVGGVKPGDLEK